MFLKNRKILLLDYFFKMEESVLASGSMVHPFFSLRKKKRRNFYFYVTLFSTILQAFANYTVKTVEFAPIVRIWYIGDADFRTQCTLSPDVEIHPNDWIGIYDVSYVYILLF